MTVASIVMPIVLAVLLLAVGAAKISRRPSMVANAEHLGYSASAYQAIGALEVAGAAGLIVGLFWPPLGIAAAVGVVALLIGAVWSLRRAGDGMKETIPAIWVGIVTAATVIVTVLTM